MRCETCQGTQWIPTGRAWEGDPIMRACPDCIGGQAHCCEGMQEQPEKDDEQERAKVAP